MSTSEIDAMAYAADRPFRRREFAGHAFGYVLVNAFLLALWGAGVGGGLWPVWVVIGWGALLAVDAWRAFVPRDRKARGAGQALPVGRPAASGRSRRYRPFPRKNAGAKAERVGGGRSFSLGYAFDHAADSSKVHALSKNRDERTARGIAGFAGDEPSRPGALRARPLRVAPTALLAGRLRRR